MRSVPERLYSVAGVRELDRRAVMGGIPARELMRRAGRAALSALHERFPGAGEVLIVAGPGNNGGDGYDLARELRGGGRRVRVLAPFGPPRSAEARAARADFVAAGGKVEDGGEPRRPAAELVVDALFGVGFARPPEGEVARWLACLAGAGGPVLALDVPSGVDADTGAVLGPAVRASLTISFVAAKRGLFTGAALDHAGEVLVDDLELPPEVFASVASAAERLAPARLCERLPRRRRDVHKGQFGHVLVIGGSRGFGGAARLAAEGALRAGAGWVSVATEPEHVPALLAGRPELMARGFEAVAALIERATVLAVGPGLGSDERARRLLALAVASGKGLVLDADALVLLAEAPCRLPPGAVITPHPGEAARLLGCAPAAVQADRFAAAAALARNFACTVVLKGAGTIVADADGTAVIAAGNPAMASAGMGDVLTGVIAGLSAQGLTPGEAARLGALAHAVAGDRAAPSAAGRGLVASDLLARLPEVLSP